MIRIHNRKHLPGGVYPPGAVYVGRPGPFGNPYSHIPGCGLYHVPTVGQAITAYADWIRAAGQAPLLARVQTELPGRDLVCSCRPLDGFQGRILCHAQILAGLANDLPPESFP